MKHGENQSVFGALLDEVLAAQRALTRCLARQEFALREDRLALRDKAVEALSAWVAMVDEARRQQTRAARRLANEITQAQLVLAAMRECAPLLVDEAEARTTAVLGIGDNMLSAYRTMIDQLVASGHAKRRNGDVVITYAGLLEITQAQKTRDALDELRTAHFQVERELHDLQQRIGEDATPVTNTSAARGAGA